MHAPPPYAGLRTSEDDPLDQKARRGAFNPEKANTPEPVVDDDDDEGIAPAIHPEGFLDEPEGDEEGAPPKEDCVLFVGDLARAISDADLERAFSSMGNVRAFWGGADACFRGGWPRTGKPAQLIHPRLPRLTRRHGHRW